MEISAAATGFDFDVVAAIEGEASRWDITVTNRGAASAAPGEVAVRFRDVRPNRVLEHGYASWSPVRRCSPTDVRPERAAIPDWARGTHAADPERSGRVVTGDHFLVHDQGALGFLGSGHLSLVEVDGAGLAAVALLDGVTLQPGESLRLDPLVSRVGDPGPAYSALMDQWGQESRARVDGRRRVGWCSWYEYFGGVTPEHIRTNLAVARDLGCDLIQIDDGYQSAIGDWLSPAPGWDGQLAILSAEIADAGMEAGVWTAPFLCGENSRVFAEHPDWVVRHASGRPMRAAYNTDHWGGWAFALDTTHPDVLDHLRTVFAALRAKGFGYHKIDFCYAAALPGVRHEPTATRARSLRLGLEAVRDGIGDDAFLLGCGCPFGPAVGVVDAMRVSADVAPVWRPALSWPGFEEAAPGAVNAIQASVLRSPLHRRLWINDPDCALVRSTGTSLDAAQRRVLADTVAGSGGFVVLSDDLARYGRAERAEVQRMLAASASSDGPLDIADPFASQVVVHGPASRLSVDWEAVTSSLEPSAG